MSMHPNSKIALDSGIAAEARIIKSYRNGESGDYTVDVMRAVSENDVVFGGYFNHGGRKHHPDGYVQVGRTMHIFEMKDGARYNEKYIGQVNRYAHVMNMFFDFDEVITYIIYGSREEVDVEVYHARDIHLVYAATRKGDDSDYNWRVDRNNSMTDADRDGFNERMRDIRQGKTQEERDANNADQRKWKAARKAKRTPAMIAKDKAIKRDFDAKRMAARSPEQKAADNARNRANRAKYTPEQEATHKANKMAYNLKRKEERTPEQTIAYNKNRAANSVKYMASKTPEQRAEIAARNLITAKERYANRTPEQKAAAKIARDIKKANRTPEEVAKQLAAKRRNAAKRRAAKLEG